MDDASLNPSDEYLAFLSCRHNFDIKVLYHFTIFTLLHPIGFSFSFLKNPFLDVLHEEPGLGESVDDGALGGGALREDVSNVLAGGDPSEGGDLTSVNNLLHPADVFENHLRLACVFGGEDG